MDKRIQSLVKQIEHLLIGRYGLSVQALALYGSPPKNTVTQEPGMNLFGRVDDFLRIVYSTKR